MKSTREEREESNEGRVPELIPINDLAATIPTLWERKVKRLGSSFVLLCASVLLLHFFSTQAVAQVAGPSPSPEVSASPSPSPSPETKTIGNDEGPPIEVKAAHVRYFFPDLAPNATTLDTKVFKIRVGFAPLVDYTFVSQDAESESQVGRQGGIGDLRSGRIIFTGAIKFKKPWTYYVAYDYNEKRNSASGTGTVWRPACKHH